MSTYTVTAPTNYTGYVGADYFLEGKCDAVSAADLPYYERHGYTIGAATVEALQVEDAPTAVAVSAEEAQEPLAPEPEEVPGFVRPASDAAKAEWVVAATDLGIDPEGKTKAELIAEVDLFLAPGA